MTNLNTRLIFRITDTYSKGIIGSESFERSLAVFS